MNRDAPSRDPSLEVVAEKFRWMKRITAPDAPGFVFVGAQFIAADFGLIGYESAISLSGKGTCVEEAFASCVGEGVEHLSRLEWGTERLLRGRPDGICHGLDDRSLFEMLRLSGHNPGKNLPAIEWMPGVRLSDGADVRVPAGLCLRRRQDAGTTPLLASSTGCAAGPTRDRAIIAALLETIERDAVALWWTGGRRGTAIGLETLARSGAADLLRLLRQDCKTRTTLLLNLTSNVAIPCIAAVSARTDGRGFACGTACRLDPADAIRAAVLELCQSELGHHLVAAKRKVRGDKALNEVDRRKLTRGRDIDARSCDLLHPVGFPKEMPAPHPATDAQAIRTVVERLQRVGVEPLLVELTRPELGVPAVRIVVPGLQPFPSTLVTGRLSAMKKHGGGRTAKPATLPLY